MNLAKRAAISAENGYNSAPKYNFRTDMANNLDDKFEDEDDSLDDVDDMLEAESLDEVDLDVEDVDEEVGLEFEEFPGEDFVEDLDEDFDDDDILVDDIDEHDDIDKMLEVGVLEPKPVVTRSEEDEEEEDEEEEDEDVEASLDDILKERLVVLDEEEEDEEEEYEDSDYRSDIALRVLPKQPDEFVCQSCFLVKNRSQLADKEKMFCRDCV